MGVKNFTKPALFPSGRNNESLTEKWIDADRGIRTDILAEHYWAE